MATPQAVLRTLRRLSRNITTGAPDTETLPELAEDWTLILAPLTDDALDASTIGYLSDPKRGKFWPAPADLLDVAGSANPATQIADIDELAWRSIATKSFYDRTPIANCEPVHMAALAAIGGRWEIQHAEGDRAIATLRKRFLEACASRRAPTVALLEGGKAPELPDNVRAFVGGEESPDRAAARRRGIARGGL